jgi:hypothetical protein
MTEKRKSKAQAVSRKDRLASFRQKGQKQLRGLASPLAGQGRRLCLMSSRVVETGGLASSPAVLSFFQLRSRRAISGTAWRVSRSSCAPSKVVGSVGPLSQAGPRWTRVCPGL